MSENLERRVFLAGEEAAWLADKIVAYGEYGNDAANLLRLLSATQQENEKLKADVAMLRDKARHALSSNYALPKNISPDTNVQKLEYRIEMRDRAVKELHEAVNQTASSDAWLNEQKAKVLEWASVWFESSPIIDAFWVRDVLKKIAAELRKE